MSSVDAFIPAWSTDALAARDIFFEEFNCVNFYVEDKEQENLYYLILCKLFPTILITQIFPLDGKTNTIAHAIDPVNAHQASRSVYILDKDFDDLLGRKVIQENIFYLPKYCIENFLLEERAILEIAIEAHPRMNRLTLQSTINFPVFFEATTQSLLPLFQLFFIVQMFNLGLKNCKSPPEQFSVKSSPEVIDSSLVEKYRAKVQEKAIETRIHKSEKEFSKFAKTVFQNGGNPVSNISGKFLLALTMHHIQRRIKFGNISFDSLSYRLARHCSLLDLEPMKNEIIAYLGFPNS